MTWSPAFIGVMQGRLLPKVGDRIQAFPGDAWAREFERAATAGLDSIEWIFETPFSRNPLWSPEGRKQIRRVMAATGVRVHFICADYFMESPWVRMSAGVAASNRRVLEDLIHAAAEIGAVGIEIPCVDASEIRNPQEEEELALALSPLLDLAVDSGLRINLETSLPPQRFRELLESCGAGRVWANYDTGNSASLGFEPAEEFAAYGSWISNVHIKDRMAGGGTVPLGAGAANIPRTLGLLGAAGYRGGLILQAARQGEELETVSGYLRKVRGWMASLA